MIRISSRAGIMAHVYSSQGVITFLNPTTLLRCKNEGVDLSQFLAVGLDGALFCVLSRVLWGMHVERVSFDFTGIAHEFFAHCEREHKTVGFVGGSQPQLDQFLGVMKARYPKLIVALARSGFFNDSRGRERVLEEVVATRPDYLVVGMGGGLQERFGLDAVAAGYLGLVLTCGGFFHQTGMRNGNYYPPLFDRLNLRWLYRVFSEKGMFMRYLTTYPPGVLLFLQADKVFTD